MRNIPRAGRLVLAALLTLAALGSVACGNNDFVATARGFEEGARAGQAEMDAWLRAGDIDQAGHDKAVAVLYEIESSAHSFTFYTNWKVLAPADKRRAVGAALSQIEPAVVRLTDAGVIKVSPRRQKRFDETLRGLRLGVAALRVILASIPDEAPAPSLTLAPTGNVKGLAVECAPVLSCPRSRPGVCEGC